MIYFAKLVIRIAIVEILMFEIDNWENDTDEIDILEEENMNDREDASRQTREQPYFSLHIRVVMSGLPCAN